MFSCVLLTASLFMSVDNKQGYTLGIIQLVNNARMDIENISFENARDNFEQLITMRFVLYGLIMLDISVTLILLCAICLIPTC